MSTTKGTPESSQIITMTRLLEEAETEIERLRRDCAEAYQVLGNMTLGVEFDAEDLKRALDNLAAAAGEFPRPHDDLLPWPRATK